MKKEFNKKLLGARIAFYRKMAENITQSDLAIKCGCTTTAISQIESGRKLPSVPMLAMIAHHLGISAEKIIEGCLVLEGRKDGEATNVQNYPGIQGPR